VQSILYEPAVSAQHGVADLRTTPARLHAPVIPGAAQLLTVVRVLCDVPHHVSHACHQARYAWSVVLLVLLDAPAFLSASESESATTTMRAVPICDDSLLIESVRDDVVDCVCAQRARV
jgi:hypothetical protein